MVKVVPGKEIRVENVLLSVRLSQRDHEYFLPWPPSQEPPRRRHTRCLAWAAGFWRRGGRTCSSTRKRKTLYLAVIEENPPVPCGIRPRTTLEARTSRQEKSPAFDRPGSRSLHLYLLASRVGRLPTTYWEHNSTTNTLPIQSSPPPKDTPVPSHRIPRPRNLFPPAFPIPTSPTPYRPLPL